MKKVKKTAKTGSRLGRRPTAKKKAAAARAGSQARPARPRPSATPRVRAIPAGFHTATPALTVRGAAQALEFYKRAFGAKERMRMPGPGGHGIMHAEIQIGDSIIFVGDEYPDMGCQAPQSLGGTTGSVNLYVPNVDQAFARAVAAGAEVRIPVADMFWGDRYAKVADPFGHEWGLATHKEDLSLKEVGQRANAFFAQMAAGGSGATPAAAGA